jgi:hypothetical protein
VGAKTFRFVNTHLESQFSFLALAQAQELLAGPANVAGPVVIVCDCNSDPLDDRVKPGDPTPHSAPYEYLTGVGGFSDEWLEFSPVPEELWTSPEQGWTSGFSESVDDDDTASIDHRIDLILARGSDGQPMPADHGVIVGIDDANRSAAGLWPSDHAGVVLRLRP